MSFFRKMQYAFARMMQGRNGIDNLGYTALWAGLIMSLLDSFIGTGLLSLMGTALYVYSIWRMFSRKVEKRAEENRKFVTFSTTWRTKVKQYFLRLKNSREFKYFHCPQCGVLIRLKRGSGERTVHCPKCHHEFQQKA